MNQIVLQFINQTKAMDNYFGPKPIVLNESNSGAFFNNLELHTTCSILYLQFEYFHYKTFMSQCVFLKFPNLKTLSIRKISFQTIQGFNRFDFPALQALELDGSEICSVKDLRKSKFPKLKNIHLCQNYVRDMEEMSRIQSQNIWGLHLEGSEDKVLTEISWLVKMKASKVGAINIPSKNRVKQQRIIERIKQKNKKPDGKTHIFSK